MYNMNMLWQELTHSKSCQIVMQRTQHTTIRNAGIIAKKQPGYSTGLPKPYTDYQRIVKNIAVIFYQMMIRSAGAIHIASPSLMPNAS